MFVYQTSVNYLGRIFFVFALNCFVYRTGGVSLTGQCSEGQMYLHNHRKVCQSKLIILNQGKIPENSEPPIIQQKFASQEECFLNTHLFVVLIFTKTFHRYLNKQDSISN